MDILQNPDISPEVAQVKNRLGIVGNTPALIEAIKRALRVAPIDLSVLITGESGSGKEFFPQIIHLYGSRKHAKYIAVNCGAIPEGTIDSELFGHEKGSFTGAVSSRKGYFEEADGGTIFLDEVGELPLTTQARLLRVLETGEFMKVGSSVVQKTNIRIVAATNVDMVKAVAEGRFREDLFYRLSTVQISIPPLRDRGNDIMLLARKFASDFAEHYHMPQISFDDDARKMMLSYRWPGNVRQLKNVVEQIGLFDAGRSINADMLSPYLPAYAPHSASVTGQMTPTIRNSYDREREMLFNLIFHLQNEVADLKKQIEHFSTTPQLDNNQQHHDTPILFKEHYTTDNRLQLHESSPYAKDIIDIDPVVVSPSQPQPDQQPAGNGDFVGTLEDNEREMIRKSLIRNDGRRKATAAELNISERTLYRKIKDYGLEDL